MTDEQLNKIAPHLSIQVKPMTDDPYNVKCPRCWHYHRLFFNFDWLCDRCSLVMIQDFKDHEATPFILENRESQKEYFKLGIKHESEKHHIESLAANIKHIKLPCTPTL